MEALSTQPATWRFRIASLNRAFIQAVAASASPTAFPQHALLKLSAAKKPASVAVAAGPDTERLDCVESV